MKAIFRFVNEAIDFINLVIQFLIGAVVAVLVFSGVGCLLALASDVLMHSVNDEQWTVQTQISNYHLLFWYSLIALIVFVKIDVYQNPRKYSK